MCGERKKREKPQRQHRFRECCSCRSFLPGIGPRHEGIGKHGFLHTALSHFLKESLVKNTLPPPDLPLWMYGYIEYLILEIEEGCTCDTRELAQVPELLGGGGSVAHTDPEKFWGTCFRGRFPYIFFIFGSVWRPANLLVFASLDRRMPMSLRFHILNQGWTVVTLIAKEGRKSATQFLILNSRTYSCSRKREKGSGRIR